MARSCWESEIKGELKTAVEYLRHALAAGKIAPEMRSYDVEGAESLIELAEEWEAKAMSFTYSPSRKISN